MPSVKELSGVNMNCINIIYTVGIKTLKPKIVSKICILTDNMTEVMIHNLIMEVA